VLPKLWRGKKRLAKKMLGPRAFSIDNPNRTVRLLRWAMTIKPGDYIATCEGCNRQVASIEPQWKNEGRWRRCKLNKTWFLSEVCFTDTRGRLHYCPGGGCAYPKETPEEVTQYFREWAAPGQEDSLRQWFGEEHDALQKSLEDLEKLRAALRDGRPIVDEHGELLPEFDKPKY
jgi:hypothetical protein